MDSLDNIINRYIAQIQDLQFNLNLYILLKLTISAPVIVLDHTKYSSAVRSISWFKIVGSDKVRVNAYTDFTEKRTSNWIYKIENNSYNIFNPSFSYDEICKYLNMEQGKIDNTNNKIYVSHDFDVIIVKGKLPDNINISNWTIDNIINQCKANIKK